MYGPSDEDVKTWIRSLIVVALACLTLAFFVGRCSATSGVTLQSPI